MSTMFFLTFSLLGGGGDQVHLARLPFFFHLSQDGKHLQLGTNCDWLPRAEPSLAFQTLWINIPIAFHSYLINN